MKGLLTYRTFQFSMSSGCFHPKITLVSLPTCFFLKALPHQGKKNPRADLINLNSATQTYVNFQLLYSLFTDCQRLFIFFFAGVAHLQLPSTYLFPGYCQKLFSTIFSRPSQSFPKEQGRDYTTRESAQVFSQISFRLPLPLHVRLGLDPGNPASEPGRAAAIQPGSGRLIPMTDRVGQLPSQPL